MAEEHPIKLRAVLGEEDIRKLVFLAGLPDSIHELEEMVREQLGLFGDFRLQYMDADFNNQFVNLSSVVDINDKDTIKVVQIPPTDDSKQDEPCTSSLDSSVSSRTSDDTASFTSDDTIIINSPQSERGRPWPGEFPIPRFSYSTETILANGNKNFVKEGSHLNTVGIKSDILEKLAEEIFKYKAYPTGKQLFTVAKALISKHPCLREPGSITGCYGWKVSLKFKMGNFRTKLRGAGCQEVVVNSLKRKQDKVAAKNIKKPRKAEVNYLPDYPVDESEATMETERVVLLNEVKKTCNETVINAKMAKTFAQRRQEVVFEKPLVADFKSRWPALFTETQIGMEFMRITTKPLVSTFMARMDEFSPKLIELLKGKGGAAGKKIKEILKVLDDNMCKEDPYIQREVVIMGLCEYLNEDSTTLVKQYMDSEEAEKIKGDAECTMGVFAIRNEDAPTEAPVDAGVIIEGTEVISSVGSIANAVAQLFGLIYALNLSYPKELKYFFEVIQKVFMRLDEEHLSPKIQSLKNKLLM